MRRLLNLLQDEDGATAVEYAVMLALLLLAMMASITIFGERNGAMWDTVDTEFSNACAQPE